jgi:hypothetical protein
MILCIIVSASIASTLIILAPEGQRYATIILNLIITGSIASALGIVALYRYGFYGVHGKSLLFLTAGLIMWLLADLTLAYYYYVFGIEEQKLVSLTDFFWVGGYFFLCLHLVLTIKLFQDKMNFKVIFIPSIGTAILLIVNILALTPKVIQSDEYMAAYILTITYPILDLSLMIPSILILINFRKNYEHSIPWILSSFSLLINAIADDGYVHDFVNNSFHALWFWDLFYVTDFIIMAGALFWINRFEPTGMLTRDVANQE